MRNKTPIILILIGAPGSGKSTFAENRLQNEQNWVRVCRDDFRAMQFQGTKANDRTEGVITGAIEASIEAFLLKKSNVLIDATHCKMEYLNQYIKRFGHLADIHFKLFDVPLAELQQRCAERERQTGKHIPQAVLEKYTQQLENLKKIFDFKPVYKKELKFIHLDQDPQKPGCFLFDLDGTIADANGRSMFSPKSEEVMNDIPIQAVIKVLQSLDKQYEIIFVSGRERTHLEVTKKWILKHIFNDEERKLNLLMRPEGDYRRDSVIKKEFLKDHIFPKYNVIAAFDDRLQVVRECWNAEGIFCFNVNQFLEEF